MSDVNDASGATARESAGAVETRRANDAVNGGNDGNAGNTRGDGDAGNVRRPTKPLLAVEGLEKHYPITEGFLRRRTGTVRAVDGIDFAVERGEAVGLIGESGCGKSTAAACVLRLEEPTGGTVRFDGADAGAFDADAMRSFRRRTAMVFQDPNASLDPRMTVGKSAAEPLAVNGVDRETRRERVAALFERVGLSADTRERYPHELSGGQKQRVGLARALSLDPEFVVLDEPVSALDVSVQAEILALLSELRAEFDLSLLFISHDVSVVREVCDRVVVMYAGELVERGPTEQVLSAPQHPYTRALAAAVPTPDPRSSGDASPLSGDVPDPADPPAGCRFHPRCPDVIPPADLDVERNEYRALVDLRVALSDGAVDAESLRELVAAERDAAPTAITDEALRETLYAEFDLPSNLSDQTAATALDDAVASVIDGDAAAAEARLEGAFESVCERTDPGMRPTTAGHVAACHLYEPE